MKPMGGGGHFSKAATQLQNRDINSVIEELEEKVKIFIRDGRL